MSAIRSAQAAAQGSVPELRFAVEGASGLEYAAVPTLKFALRIEAVSGHPVRSILLCTLTFVISRRNPAWMPRRNTSWPCASRKAISRRATGWPVPTCGWSSPSPVPPFGDSTVVDLLAPCTYDLEVTATRYFAALKDGVIPLEFLFSGSVFFATAAGALQTTRIAWDSEVDYRLPVGIWKETMNRHFPGSAWLRLGSESFDRLCAYKARHAFESWEKTIESLLDQEGSR